MRPFAALLFAALLGLPVLAQSPSLPAAVQTEAVPGTFHGIAERWMAAYNGPDAKALEPFYAEDAQYISGHVPGLVARGRDQVLAYLQAGMKLGGHLNRLSVLSVAESCDLATVLCDYHATNAGEKARGRSLLLFRRQGQGWRIYLHMAVV